MNKTMTITEALAELKTIDKRIDSTEQFILQYGIRQGSTIDPLGEDGGSESVIPQKMQSLKDLLQRKVTIRCAINESNTRSKTEIAGISKTVAEWIVWRRETFQRELSAYRKLKNHIIEARKQCVNGGLQLKDDGTQPNKVSEVASFIPEIKIQDHIEKLEEIESTLDGRLSLINATTTITI